MAGFPNRPDLAALGPDLVNARPLGNPNEEATAEQYNLIRWQLAGIGLLAYQAHLIFTAQAGSQPILHRAEAWNPRGLTTGGNANPTITRVGTGNYDVTYPTQVPDQLGDNVAVGFRHGIGTIVTPSSTTFRHVMVTPKTGVPSAVKVMLLDAAGAAVDGHDVSILIG